MGLFGFGSSKSEEPTHCLDENQKKMVVEQKNGQGFIEREAKDTVGQVAGGTLGSVLGNNIFGSIAENALGSANGLSEAPSKMKAIEVLGTHPDCTVPPTLPKIPQKDLEKKLGR